MAGLSPRAQPSSTLRPPGPEDSQPLAPATAAATSRPRAFADALIVPSSSHGNWRSWKGKARDDASSSEVGSDGSSPLKPLRRAVATGPVAEGYPDCSRVGNDQRSCYPLSNTSVTQNAWSKLIWNANYPSFIAADNLVDVYLYLGTSDALIETWTSLPNEESQLAFQPTDDWWQDEYGATDLASGANQTWEAYFVIVPGGHSIVGTESHEPTFAALQTALPTTASLSLESVSSTRSLSSIASAEASLSSVSTRSTASASSASALASISSLSERIKTDPIASSSVAANGGIGSLQGNLDSNDNLPKYAIALLSVLGALLLITTLALVYFFLRRLHKRRFDKSNDAGYYGRSPSSSVDASFASGRPIIGSSAAGAAAATGASAAGAAAGGRRARDSSDPHSPTSPPGTATDESHSYQQPPARVLSPSPNFPPPFVPGPRSVSSQSYQTSALGSSVRPHPSFATSPLSETDAASISAAYRSALSHPEFGKPPVEGDSPPTDAEDDSGERMRRELEREGIGLRGVPGGKGGQTVD